SPLNEPQAAETVTIASATADYAEPDFPIEGAFDGNPDTGWSIYRDGDMNTSREAIFVFETPIGYPVGTILKFTLDQGRGRAHTIGRMRFSTTTVDPSILAIPDTVFSALKTPADQRTDEQNIAIVD